MGSSTKIAGEIKTAATCHRSHRKIGECPGTIEGLFADNLFFLSRQLFPGWTVASTLTRNSSKLMPPRGPSWSLIFNPFSLLAFQTESTNSASSIVQNGCCLEALDPHEHAALCFCQATCSRRVVHFLSRRRKFWFESCKAQVQWRDIHPENWEEKAWIAVINI